MNNMKTIYATVFFAFLLCFAGCTENEMMEYENDPAIYFANRDNYGNKKDSINIVFSFFYSKSNVTHTSVPVRINTMGKLEPVDRPFSVVQTNIGQPGAAIPGVHYLPFDDPYIKETFNLEMVIKANQWYGYVPVVFLRDPSLDLETVRLELAVAENDYFRPGINTHRRYVLTATSQAVKPGNWDTFWYMVFGRTWGSVKMRFIIDITGYTEWDQQPNDVYFTAFLRTLILEEFKKYNEEHPDKPLREANGDLVNFDI